MDLANLSRVVSHALRHEPWLYELELDEEGWVPAYSLVAALRVEKSCWAKLTQSDLENMIAKSETKRHELRDDKIRALYGHSVSQRLLLERAAPPSTLYHGTSVRALESIKREGLRPMGRQYVHLSTDAKTATKVGSRKDKSPVILKINSGAAYELGVAFYHGNEMVWLADRVPAVFVEYAQ
jgi:putative RNA 2'-phosphotransferase